MKTCQQHISDLFIYASIHVWGRCLVFGQFNDRWQCDVLPGLLSTRAQCNLQF